MNQNIGSAGTFWNRTSTVSRKNSLSYVEALGGKLLCNVKTSTQLVIYTVLL